MPMTPWDELDPGEQGEEMFDELGNRLAVDNSSDEEGGQGEDEDEAPDEERAEVMYISSLCIQYRRIRCFPAQFAAVHCSVSAVCTAGFVHKHVYRRIFMATLMKHMLVALVSRCSLVVRAQKNCCCIFQTLLLR